MRVCARRLSQRLLIVSTVLLLTAGQSNVVSAACEDGTDVCLELQSSEIVAGEREETSVEVTSNAGATSSVDDNNTEQGSPGLSNSEALVNAITADLKARRLTKPDGDNALQKIDELRAIDPAHDYSINGRRYIARIYLSMARNDLENNRLDRAGIRLEEAVGVLPTLKGLAAVRQRLNDAQGGGATVATATQESEPSVTDSAAPQPAVEQTESTEPVTAPEGGDNSGRVATIITPVMVGLPAGSFVMGSEFGAENEKPAHEVRVEAFSMSRYEVTREQFHVYLQDTGIEAVAPMPEEAKLPVADVTSHEAEAYAAWLADKTGKDYRLPSESEWEYAVRAGTMTPYFTGDSIFGRANCLTCLHDVPQAVEPVGSFDPNGFGLYDMHGNVSEWTASCLTSNYFNIGVEQPEDCALTVVRGGSWRSTREQVRSSFRTGQAPSARTMDTGFRVVHDGL